MIIAVVFYSSNDGTIGRIDIGGAAFDPQFVLDHCDAQKHRFPMISVHTFDATSDVLWWFVRPEHELRWFIEQK